MTCVTHPGKGYRCGESNIASPQLTKPQGFGYTGRHSAEDAAHSLVMSARLVGNRVKVRHTHCYPVIPAVWRGHAEI